ncbi:hypothetical protein THERMOT_256 [Bathymodiolus thermophilus thioautotrophic gill symbiont]|uniref:hypothetical protein n=1 Tax=Bathymodiolus thermophilus thioautotrophic gill symbiont TaxID=2360 RepID=UPI00192C653E|nr:hypothetical protein [Bathymodiolus thermophilus thioautotrophic gill symbiont]CAB5495167.1 hypothetical protein THERMOT_256 [Bathymodiolus thermophilus thioautotrophic gill symbiont]
MNIHQMQISYSNQEDRLILSINSKENEELRLFLTRRIVASFWEILNKTISHSLSIATPNDILKPKDGQPESQKKQMEQKMEQQIQHQNIIEKSDYETPFNNGNKFPVGEAPILVEKITINVYENNNTALIFESNNGQNINLNLNPQLLHNLSDLLIRVMPSTNWNIDLMSETNILIPDNQDKLALH